MSFYMRTSTKSTAYEAPQTELLLLCTERNLLLSETGTASGQDISLSDEEAFDDYFNN